MGKIGWVGVTAIAVVIGCGGGNGSGGTGGGGAGGATPGKGGSTGTGGSGAGTFSTSVPGSTKLTDLTTTQVMQICGDIATYVDDKVVPTLCGHNAQIAGLEGAELLLLQNPSATNTELQAACIQTVATTDAGSCGPVDGGTQACNVTSEPAGCTATVADLTTCANDDFSALSSYYDSLPSCASLTSATVTAFFALDGGLDTGPPVPTACSAFNATCNTMVTR